MGETYQGLTGSVKAKMNVPRGRIAVPAKGNGAFNPKAQFWIQGETPGRATPLSRLITAVRV